MTSDEVARLPSIQGEGYRKPEPEPMTAQEIDVYVDTHSEGIVTCRSRRRHDYPQPRPGVMVEFDAIDDDDNLIVHKVCTSCGCAVRREVWTAQRFGRRWRYQFLTASTMYQKNALGETYLMPPGSGRSQPRQFEESLMTQAMAGQSPAALRKHLRRTRR